ncbi:YxiG-like protein [Streptomyces sp. NPDC002690]
MDPALLDRLNADVDQLVVHHGYTNYMRDYEVVFDVGPGGPHVGTPTFQRYLFRYCVEARCETFQSAETWRASLDDRLLDLDTADPALGGYVWGVKFHELYDIRLRPGSDATRRWTEAVGIDFHEVRMETNAHDLTLLFSDLEVCEVPVGYAPFVAGEELGPSGPVPAGVPAAGS